MSNDDRTTPDIQELHDDVAAAGDVGDEPTPISPGAFIRSLTESEALAAAAALDYVNAELLGIWWDDALLSEEGTHAGLRWGFALLSEPRSDFLVYVGFARRQRLYRRSRNKATWAELETEAHVRREQILRNRESAKCSRVVQSSGETDCIVEGAHDAVADHQGSFTPDEE